MWRARVQPREEGPWRTGVATPPACMARDAATASTSTASGSPGTPAYQLGGAATEAYKAAGVLFYSCKGQDIQLLMVQQVDSARATLTVPGGKRTEGEGPAATASREAEEETHWLLPTAAVRPLLPHCPACYIHDSKYALYLLRVVNGEELPGLAEAQVAAGRIHPEAEKIRGLAWVGLEEALAGRAGDVQLHRFTSSVFRPRGRVVKALRELAEGRMSGAQLDWPALQAAKQREAAAAAGGRGVSTWFVRGDGDGDGAASSAGAAAEASLLDLGEEGAGVAAAAGAPGHASGSGSSSASSALNPGAAAFVPSGAAPHAAANGAAAPAAPGPSAAAGRGTEAPAGEGRASRDAEVNDAAGQGAGGGDRQPSRSLAEERPATAQEWAQLADKFAQLLPPAAGSAAALKRPLLPGAPSQGGQQQ